MGVLVNCSWKPQLWSGNRGQWIVMEKGDPQMPSGSVEWGVAELVVRWPAAGVAVLPFPTVSAGSPIILDRSASNAGIKLAHALNGALWCAPLGDNRLPDGGEC